MKHTIFGYMPTGEEVRIYTLKNDNASVSIMTRGATIVDFTVFGVSIVGGFDDFETYLLDTSHQGAIIGRVANRIGGAQFTMDGKTYHVPKNNNGNCLHGGRGFDYRLFTVKEVTDNSITLCYTSADGEEGFPSCLHVAVTYTLVGTSLRIDYVATPEGKTPIILTNHSYFNLDGFGGTVLNHTVKMYADIYTELNDELIPTGRRLPVQGTVYDLNTPTKLGERINGEFKGYDIYFHANPQTFATFDKKRLGLLAEVDNGKLKLKTYTDQPGAQLYTANTMGKGPAFKGGVKKINYGAFCIETHTEPDCISRGEEWYGADDTYTQTTVYEVSKI
ncbi:MAG: galactose mutarotase [Clostridia bacterium]|nr:galactose mutarotase [Clostridia bacterium]